MPSPNFLVVGAARAGTTALIEGLRLHPDAFVTMPKEPHYFAFHGSRPAFRGPGDEAAINAVSVTDLPSYLALYDEADGRLARGDGSVTTLYYAERAVDEIRRVNPEMRIVVILREPIDRAFSCFSYLKARGVETAPDFATALDLEAQRTGDNWHHMWHYAAVSRYAASVRMLQEGLGRAQVGVWFYDDLQSDYSGVLDEVRTFLDLPPFPAAPPDLPRVNVSGTPRLQVAQRAIRWATEHEQVRGAIKRVVGFQARERIRRSVLRSDPVPSDQRERLAAGFADDLADLATLVDGDLPEWLVSSVQPPVDQAGR